MRRKLGIIQLELPSIILSNNFNDNAGEEITSLLSEEQKEIIKSLGGSKLVLLNVELTDDIGHIAKIKNGMCSVAEYSGTKGLFITTIDDSETNLVVRLLIYEQSGKYYIFS